MIRLYYGSSSTSSRMAYAWFKNRALEISIRKTKYISKEDLLHILRLSNNGFSDILKSGNKSTSKIQQKIELLKEMKFNDGLNYIMENPEVLRVPIIFDEKNYSLDIIQRKLESLRQHCIVEGIIKWMKNAKGFDFIITEDGAAGSSSGS